MPRSSPTAITGPTATSPAVPPTKTVQLADEPGHGAYTVEDLAQQSDAVVLTSKVTVLKRMILNGSEFLIAEVVIDQLLGGGNLDGESSLVTGIIESAVPEASLAGSHILFLVATPTGLDAAAKKALDEFGGRYMLVPGEVAVLDVDNGTVTARGGTFYGLRSKDGLAQTVPQADGTGVLAEPPQAHSFSFDDVVAAIMDAGPKIAPTPVVTDPEDTLWLESLNSSCRAAKPAAANLRALLTDASADQKSKTVIELVERSDRADPGYVQSRSEFARVAEGFSDYTGR